MDNNHISITWEGEERFRNILSLILDQRKGKTGKIEHYCIDPDYGMIFFWTDCTISQPMPYPMKVDAAVQFAWNWLQTADYGPEPDHDGSNGRGWRIFNETWGHVKGEWAGICAIQPAWAMYGK
jgi:hypothetical protein